MYSDRRRAPRVEVLGRMHGEIMSKDIPVTMREVSLGGLSFSSALPFLLGGIHEFRLTLGDDSAVLLRGRIVRSESQHETQDGARLYLTGVQFLDDDDPNADDVPVSGLIDKIQ